MTGEPRAFASGRLRLDFPAQEVARLTIDHPAKRNALDREILDALAAEVPQLQARCLLLTAAGPVFSAGYDMRILPGGGPAEEAAIEALAGHPFPTVAALNGHAIGGGLELALACDLRIAAEPAELGMPPARLGLIYSHAGLRRFLDVIGVARTSELFFTARNVPARRALEWGLVNEVVAAHELEAFAVAYAAAIAAHAPGSLAGNKRVMRELLAASGRLPEEVARELAALRDAGFASEDFAEGLRAFAERRPPRFTGR